MMYCDEINCVTNMLLIRPISLLQRDKLFGLSFRRHILLNLWWFVTMWA